MACRATWVGVPYYWLPIGGFFSAFEPVALIGMAIYASSAMRRSGMLHPNTLALHWTLGSAVFTLFGAGLLGSRTYLALGEQVDAGLFIWDFFRTRPRFEILNEGRAAAAWRA